MWDMQRFKCCASRLSWLWRAQGLVRPGSRVSILAGGETGEVWGCSCQENSDVTGARKHKSFGNLGLTMDTFLSWYMMYHIIWDFSILEFLFEFRMMFGTQMLSGKLFPATHATGWQCLFVESWWGFLVTYAWRIHGTKGIFPYMNGRFWW